MLQKLREKTSGWIGATILGLLTIPFAFFGMESYMSQSVETYVARIAQPPAWWQSAPQVWPVTYFWHIEDIDAQAFRERLELVRARMRDAQGDAFDPKAFEQVENKRRIVDAMIDERLMQLAADRDHVVVSDQEVQNAIQRIPDFQVDGQFNADRYQLLLASQNPPMTPRAFDAKIREELKNSLIPDGIENTAFMTNAELDRLMRLLGEHRDVSFVMMPQAAPDTAEVTAAQIDAWFKAHKGEYRKPESVRLEYVEVDASRVPEVAVDDAELQKRYQQQIAKYSSAEKRDIAHILIAVPSTADAAAKKAAEAKARKLADEARAPGADFAALAKANSDDAGSKGNGGDLGMMSKGGMPGAFDDAAFAMKEGEVRGPVKSDFGWHIIKVKAIQPGVQRSFEEVRPELVKEVSEGSRERAFNELTGKLVDAVYKNPTSLEPAAKAMGLEVKTTPMFTRAGGPGIASNAKVLRAAFSDVLIQDGTASDPIELAPEHSVIVRVIEHQPEAAQKLDDVRDAVIAAIRHDRASKAEAAAAEMFLKAAQQKGIAEAATAAGLQLGEANDIKRGTPIPSPQASEAFFNQPRPQADKPVLAKTQVNGQYIVFAVRAARDADIGQVSPQERAQLRQQVSRANGMEAQQAFISSTRKLYKIKVAEDRL